MRIGVRPRPQAPAHPAGQAPVADAPPPTIKGIFVNSHVRAIRRLLGDEGLQRIEDAFHGPVWFGATDDVPTDTESRLIEAAVRLLSDGPMAADGLAYEAGRLHYRNFTGTPWGKVLFSIFPRDFAFMMRHAGGIAEKVFSHVTFHVKEFGPRSFCITIDNGGYPLGHFRGLLQEWMDDFGCEGRVLAQEPQPGRQEHLVQWG